MVQHLVLTVKNLDKAGDYAEQILSHIAAIKEIQKQMGWNGAVNVEASFQPEQE